MIMPEDIQTRSRRSTDVELSREELLAAYRVMLLTRLLDSKALGLHNQGRIGSYTSSAGHEGTHVGSVYGLDDNDWIFPYYRDQGVLLARGVTVEQLLNRYFGNAADLMKGRDLPNLYSFRERRIFSIAAPIASNLMISVGFAMAARRKGENIIAISYFGDGATSSGEFHVALNFAGVFKAPCIFVCENNQYAISVPFKRQTASSDVASKAKAYGIEGHSVDGNDFFAVRAAVSAARKRALQGQGSTLIECVTYRHSAHSTADEWTRYRTKEELEEWKKRDPVRLMKDRLIEESILTEQSEREIASEVQAEIAAAIKSSENIPPPPEKSLLTDVYSDFPALNLPF